MVSKLTTVIDSLIQEILQSEEKIRIYNNTLCPDIWEDKKINSEVRIMLLKIATDFLKNNELKNIKIKDIQLLGSLANYNWTPTSDLDTHIIVDATEVGWGAKDQEKYLGAIVGKWNAEHDINIKGHTVELYLQSYSEKNASTAVYSLLFDKWIKLPQKEKITVDRDSIQKKYSHWLERINTAINSKDEKLLKKILEKLKEYRQSGLDKNGEFSNENLVFKILRSKGIIDKLKSCMVSFYDDKHSIKDGFDPCSQAGPNLIDPSSDNGGYYRQQNTKMRHMENVNENVGGGMISGGFGSGKREEDRLAIKNKDGSLRRWQIRSKDIQNATPEIPEWIQEIVNEVMDKYFPTSINEMPQLSKHGTSVISKDKLLKNMSLEDVKENIVFFRQSKSGGWIAEGYTLIYFMDSTESAIAMTKGEIPYLTIPRGTFISGGSPITDVWKKKYQQPGQEHILGILEGNIMPDLAFIDMITVKPGYKRNSIASKMLELIKKEYPSAKITTSDQTQDGRQFFATQNT